MEKKAELIRERGQKQYKKGKHDEHRERTGRIPSHFSINPRQKGEVRGIMTTRCGHYTCAFRFLRSPQKFGRNECTVAEGFMIWKFWKRD